MKQLLFPLLILLFGACEREELNTPCGPDIALLQGSDHFPAGDDFDPVDAGVSGDCLMVQIGASGCSPDGWSLRLYTNGVYFGNATSATLVFDDGVPEGSASCEAYFQASFSFDISDLRVGVQPVQLTLYSPGADTTLYIE